MSTDDENMQIMERQALIIQCLIKRPIRRFFLADYKVKMLRKFGSKLMSSGL